MYLCIHVRIYCLHIHVFKLQFTGVQSSLFKCDMCEKSFKTNRGLKQHVSKSHKVSAKNGHDSPVLPINEDTSGTERPGKKEKSSADEDKCQNEDIVEARSNNAEGSVLGNSELVHSHIIGDNTSIWPYLGACLLLF